MAKFFSRILVAAGLSMTSYFSVEYWYSLQPKITAERSQKKEAARLVDHNQEVQRKPLSHVIWETVSKGDVLFLGEEIRTTANSEATILFKESNTILELEPDSLIILEESKDGLELNFLRGNLFVKGGGGKSSGLRLKSGKSVILTQSSELSLSKKGNKTDINIFKGAAKLKQGGKVKKIGKKDSGLITSKGINKSKATITVKYPTPSQTIYIDQARSDTVPFKWKKLNSNYFVHLEIGKKRNKLKKISNTKVAGAKGELFARIPLGRFYWRLVGTHRDKSKAKKVVSAVIPSLSKAKRPTLLLLPVNNSLVTNFDSKEMVRFQWGVREGLEGLLLEIATDKLLKRKIVSQGLKKAPTFLDINLQQKGVYYWRITGYIKDSQQSIAVPSQVQTFTLSIGANLRPPLLITPKLKKRIPLITVLRDGIKFNWENVPGMEKYKINIQESRTKGRKLKPLFSTSKESFGPPLILKGMNSGRFTWNVISINRDGKFSKPSPSRKFTVLSLPKLEWVLGNGPTTYLYSTPQPSLFANWKRGRLITSQWKVRWAKAGAASEDFEEQTVGKPSIAIQVEEDGVYEIEVEAIGRSGQSIAKTTSKLFTIKERPLLPSPKFSASLPRVVKSNRRGKAKLQWKAVKGAKSYLVEVRSSTGQLVSQKTVKRSLASFDRLQPGKYGVTIKAVDRYNRQGPESEAKGLEVPNRSNISAPKLKGIRVR